jgi:type II secretory pathway pseudopilin PulG
MSIQMNWRGLTFIEILLIVAIVAVLAVVATPNFLEVNPRAPSSRARSDIRTMTTGIEAYMVDHKTYPGDHLPDPTNPLKGLYVLTSPIAYVSTLPISPFNNPKKGHTYYYGSGIDSDHEGNTNVQSFVLVSLGPDKKLDSTKVEQFPWGSDFIIYDATNGTDSGGDIIRFGHHVDTGDFTIEGVHWKTWIGPGGSLP